MIAGETVAETRRPTLLFETSLPTRYYLPPEAVRTDLLEPSETTSRCPHKGIAVYWSVRIGDQVARDVVWSYPDPIAECPKIRGLLCFFNERVDIYLDGERHLRPHTPWSEGSDDGGASRAVSRQVQLTAICEPMPPPASAGTRPGYVAVTDDRVGMRRKRTPR